MNIKKTKIFDKFKLSLVILLAIFSTGTLVLCTMKYFEKHLKDPISIYDIKDYPKFNVVKTDGNNLTKKIFPLTLPNLSPSTTATLIKITHEATLNAPNMEIEVPMYLQIKNHFDTLGTFTLQENDFQYDVKCDSTKYVDSSRPQMKLINRKAKIVIDYQIETIREFENHNNKLDFVSIYELVDKDGKSFEGSTPQVVKNLIKLTN
ncbi:hypothetical protein [Candidatus Phytoplasma pyri]|uniref:hypothetical protein n=1 Tax=Candidatus Phytoplasma pyri TaxID=47566 RepID=UPI0039830599